MIYLNNLVIWTFLKLIYKNFGDFIFSCFNFVIGLYFLKMESLSTLNNRIIISCKTWTFVDSKYNKCSCGYWEIYAKPSHNRSQCSQNWSWAIDLLASIFLTYPNSLHHMILATWHGYDTHELTLCVVIFTRTTHNWVN